MKTWTGPLTSHIPSIDLFLDRDPDQGTVRDLAAAPKFALGRLFVPLERLRATRTRVVARFFDSVVPVLPSDLPYPVLCEFASTYRALLLVPTARYTRGLAARLRGASVGWFWSPGLTPPPPPFGDLLWVDMRGKPMRNGVVEAALDHLVHRGSAYRLVVVNGFPICQIPGASDLPLGSGRRRVFASDPCAQWSVEDPGRVYFRTCWNCTHLVGCDGFDYRWFAEGQPTRGVARRIRMYPFGQNNAATTYPLSPEALVHRFHPRTLLATSFHTFLVATGAKPAGREAVARDNVRQSIENIRAFRLHVDKLAVGGASHDIDAGQGGTRYDYFVFFSREPDRVRRLMDIQRVFVEDQRNLTRGLDDLRKATERMGSLLGYPSCCISSFLEQDLADDIMPLLRKAAGRTRRFHPVLNCLDLNYPLNLVRFYPCSFDCGAALRIASRALRLAACLYLWLHRSIVRHARRAVLALDSRRLVYLAGRVVASAPDPVVAYDSVDGSYSRAREAPDPSWGELIATLARGDTLRVRGARVQVMRKGRPAGEIRLPVLPLLLPFH